MTLGIRIAFTGTVAGLAATIATAPFAGSVLPIEVTIMAAIVTFVSFVAALLLLIWGAE